MSTCIITPEQQVANLREVIWTREYELENRGVPIREIMALVRQEMYLAVFEQRVARGEIQPVEIQPVEIHECDAQCVDPCPDWED